MKRPYTTPEVIKVPLNPEQAVLATCSVGATTVWKNIPLGWCSSRHNCKIDRIGHGDQSGNS